MNPSDVERTAASNDAADDAVAKTDVVLDIAGLRAGYGHVPVLHGIDFQLREGEAVGIVGHNGVGKSTFLKALIGLVPATAGRVSIDGIDATRMKAYERSRLGLGYVPQGRGILPGLTALENLRLAWTADSGDIEAAAIERVVDTLPRLRALLDRKGGALSGGEQQILALGRALMPAPWLLLLDEPSEGIQPSIVQEIGEILAALRKREKVSLLIVEQNLDLVLDVADRIVVIERGRIQREVDAHVVQAGGLAEMLGMGARRQANKSAAGRPPGLLNPQAPAALGGAPRAPARHDARPAAPPLSRMPVSAMPAPPPTLPARTPSAPTPVNRGDTMTMVKRPTIEQLQKIVQSLHMSMSEREIGEYLDVLEGTMQAYDRVEQLPDYLPEVRYPRTPGTRPSPSENPLGAWYVKSEVKGAPYGPLAGKRVVLKDNVCLAGVPMMNGASTLEGYVPDVDATVVTRILDAGGTIVGKAHCEYFCLSGGSHTSAAGPVHNPYKIGYSAGGSSSGCAALVGAGEVEMAIGGDQGGSIRMPGSFSGVYGMKATHGLVPYTGVMPIEATIDHTGPMTAHGGRQRAAARGDRRPRRARPTPVQRARRQVHRRARPRRRGPAHRCADRRVSPSIVGTRRRPEGARGCRAIARARRDRRGGLDPDAPGRPGHLDADRARRPAGADDARQRHGLQLGRPVHDQPARCARQLARARQSSCRAR